MNRTAVLSSAALLLVAAGIPGQRRWRDADAGSLAIHRPSTSLQVLAVPPARSRVAVAVRLGGDAVVMDLHRYELRTPGFRLLVDDGARLRDQATPLPVTYRGTLRGRSSSRVAATITDGRLRALVRSAGELWSVEPLDERSAVAAPGTHLVQRGTGGWSAPLRCGTAAAGGFPVPLPAAADGLPVLSVAELAIDADEPLFRARGSSVRAVHDDILGILNAVDLIYNAEVGIAHRISAIVVRTAPTYTADGISLLLQFRSRWVVNHGDIPRDVAHLFSGRPASGGVAGVALAASVCDPLDGYAVSWTLSVATPAGRAGLTAHELAHNWGAGHCDGAGDCALMCSFLGGCTGDLAGFGADARAAIAAFRAGAACLGTAPLPTAAPFAESLVPAAVSARAPVPVTVHGTDLDMATSVAVDGLAVAYSVDGADSLTFAPPDPLEIADHEVTVTGVLGASTLSLRAEGKHPGVLNAPASLVRGETAAFSVHTDREWLGLLLVSTSDLPSELAGIVALGLGNGFTDLISLPLAADATGLAVVEVTVPAAVPPLTSYWQAVTVPVAEGFPLPVETTGVVAVPVF